MDIERLVFLYFTINSIKTVSLVSMRELPKSDIIITINKGCALRRIGTYSPNVEEQIVHTFIHCKLENDLEYDKRNSRKVYMNSWTNFYFLENMIFKETEKRNSIF